MEHVDEVLEFIGSVARGEITEEEARQELVNLFNTPKGEKLSGPQEIVDVHLIKLRKELYGNNFPCIAKMWETYLTMRLGKTVKVTDEDVAVMMGLMKVSRLAQTPAHGDSIIDLINYFWIGLNYKDYMGVGSE